MKQDSVNLITKALGLEHHVVGVKLIYYKEDYDAVKAEPYHLRTSFCGMVKQAYDGLFFKATEGDLICDYGAYALGLREVPVSVARGSSYGYCGLYESDALAYSITREMCYIDSAAYGVVLGPLEMMDDADVVIIVSTAENMMRIVQGYGYKFGMPHNIRMLGNQAACSELMSKPFTKNDINFSLMCAGARRWSKCDAGEMGVSMPINQFDPVVEGVLRTVNPVSTNAAKQAILSRLSYDNELGFDIDFAESYAKKLEEYDARAERLRAHE